MWSYIKNLDTSNWDKGTDKDDDTEVEMEEVTTEEEPSSNDETEQQ